jgi:AraC family transcriptional regulator
MTAQEPRIEQKGAMRLAGMYYRGKNANGEIAAMWDQKFIPRIQELRPDTAGGFVAYGACRMPEEGAEPGAFEYLAAVEVPSLENLPDGMVGWEIPAQTYAVLPAHGLDEIPRVFDYLYSQWAPSSTEWEAADSPCFELYPLTFPDDPTVDIYMPVRKKA